MLRIAGLLICLGLSWQGLALKSAPAPSETKQDPCQLWRGSASGNDPSVSLELTLCEGEAGLYGTVEWSSAQSGWNLRWIEGAVEEEGALNLRDLQVIKAKPRAGWRFCTIDQYRLTKTAGDAMKGSYRSEACDDSASLQFVLVKSSVPPPRP